MTANSSDLFIVEPRRQHDQAPLVVGSDAARLELTVNEHLAFRARLVAVVDQQLQQHVLGSPPARTRYVARRRRRPRARETI